MRHSKAQSKGYVVDIACSAAVESEELRFEALTPKS